VALRGTQRKRCNLTEGPVVHCGGNRHGKVASAVQKNSLETTQRLHLDTVAHYWHRNGGSK